MELNKKTLFELRKMKIEEVSKYYLELRKYKYEQGEKLKGIELRKKIHFILLQIIKLERILSNESLTIVSDERIKTNKTKVYACTHIGGNDVQRTFEAIKEHAYLFLGDPKEIYRDMTGKILFLNGAICLETANKTDRRIAKERGIELLNNGGNLLIYPEGAWNITQNLPVMKLYTGAADIARVTNSDIIPVAIEQDKKDFYVSIGKNIDTAEFKDIPLKELNEYLRDMMATEKWKTWESIGSANREEFTQEYRENFAQSIVDKCGYDFSLQDVYDTMYKDPNEASEEEVFSFQRKLIKN